MTTSTITEAQLRAARGLLNLTAEQLAKEAGLSLRTIRRAEEENGLEQLKADTVQKIAAALEAHDILFIAAKGGKGVGVRFRCEE